MADSFAGGIAQGLDSLLPSIRAERERKAQEKFKLDLYNDEKKTNDEVRRLATKQRALEIFGQGIAEIQRQKTKMTLDMLVNRHSKGAQNLSLIVNEMDDQIKSTDAEIKALRSKMYDYYNQSNRDNEKPDKQDPLMSLEGGTPKEKKKTNFLETDLYKGMQAQLDTLEANKKALLDSKKANLSKLSSGSESLTQQAEQISKAFTIDDALASREGEVLKESLGLTDEDVARFKIRKGNAGSLDAYVNDNTQPDYSPVSFEPDYKKFGLDEKLLPSDVLENPAKRAMLKEKIVNAVKNIPNDITSLKVLTNQDLADARNDSEISPILEQGFASVKNIGGTVKQRLLQGTASDAEIKTLDNIAKMAKEFSPEQFNKVRNSNGDDGSTLTLQFLTDLTTPDTFSGLSRLNEARNTQYAQKDLNTKVGKLDSYIGGANQELQGLQPNIFGGYGARKKRLETDIGAYTRSKNAILPEIQKSETELKSLDSLIQNMNDIKNTLVDPSKKYQYRPTYFGQ
jgi:hypothetical protein